MISRIHKSALRRAPSLPSPRKRGGIYAAALDRPDQFRIQPASSPTGIGRPMK